MDEAEDELIGVLPIHYSTVHSENIHLHQFPLMTRPLQPPPSAKFSGKRIKARIKPNTHRMEIHVPTDNRPDVWNIDRSKVLGAAQAEDDREKNLESKGKEQDGEEPRLTEIRMQSEEVLHRNTFMLGVVHSGALHLHPISQTHQFRPSLDYLDTISRKKRRPRSGDVSDSDDGPPPDPDEPTPVIAVKKERKAATEAREVQVTARKVDEKGNGQMQGGLTSARREMLQAIRAEEDEKWQDLEYHDSMAEETQNVFQSVLSKSDDILDCKTDITTFLKDINGL